MCDHDEDKKSRYILLLGVCGHEVHMCECGALIDINAEKNYNACEAMTPDELDLLLAEIFVEAMPIRSEQIGRVLDEYMAHH
jgi:hypothetical protein